ncbi:MAG: energy-coupling factor ABC transporter substrate-binding protein [Gloeomargarita sp. DG02_4_bins_56]
MRHTAKSPAPSGWVNILLILAVVGLAAIPLVIRRGAEFAGADAQATEAVEALQPDYEPWVNPVFEPASGEIESLLFALQAGLGAGVMGYIMGRYQSRWQNEQGEPRD